MKQQMKKQNRTQGKRFKSALIMFAVSAVGLQVLGQSGGEFDDHVNSDLERRLYNMFVRAGAPVSDEKWATVLGTHASEVYKIQAGDTLWEISETFFADGGFWPKLWSENGAIENPHVIVPGKIVKFVAGTESDAPSLSVVEAKPDTKVSAEVQVEESSSSTSSDSVGAGAINVAGNKNVFVEKSNKSIQASSVVDDAEMVIERPEIPPPPPRSRFLATIPPSFISPIPVSEAKFDSTGLSVIKGRAQTEHGRAVIPYYVSETEPEGIGTVSEIEASELMASDMQYVLLRLQKKVEIGTHLMTAVVKRPVEFRKKKMAEMIEVGGEVEVTELLSADENVYRALVLRSVNAVARGSLVLTEALPETDYSVNGRRVDVETTVIGGEFDERKTLHGSGALIYLDGGSDKGLQPGDLLAIRASRESRLGASTYGSIRTAVGVAKIVRTEKSVATAVIVDMQDRIESGDTTGGSFPVPQVRGTHIVKPKIIDIDITDNTASAKSK